MTVASVGATAFTAEQPRCATMGEGAFEMLRQAILSGALRPGEQLRLDELVSASGMSRMPIREALAELARVGLVESKPRYSARVTELSREELRDVFDARLALEAGAIAAAASRFEAEDRSVADRWLESLREAVEAGKVAATSKAHAQFHLALYRGIGSRWLERLVCPLWDISERYFITAFGVTAVLPEGELGEHERLLAACVSRDPDLAAAELRRHLTGDANRIACAIDGEELYGSTAARFSSAGDSTGLPRLR